jgi:hypothetical protein
MSSYSIGRASYSQVPLTKRLNPHASDVASTDFSFLCHAPLALSMRRRIDSLRKSLFALWVVVLDLIELLRPDGLLQRQQIPHKSCRIVERGEYIRLIAAMICSA